jgi:zinc transporter ZupT
MSLLKRTFAEGLAIGLSVGASLGMLVTLALIWARR